MCLSTAFASTIKTTSFSAIDVYKAHDQDVVNEKLGNAPRFALEHVVAIDPMNATNWKIQNGMAVWKHRVNADRAVSLNFAFGEFQLSENAKLNIYASDMSDSIRTFTADDNNVDNKLWTPVIMAHDVVVELSVPVNEMELVSLALTQVNQGYRKFTETTEKSGSCNIDVVCSESSGWEQEVNAVGVISTGGSTFCTGFMVNNTANDKTPFFMTANHCKITKRNAASLVVYWNYQASACGGSRNGKKRTFNTGSTFLSASAKSDFALVRLNKAPKPEWNVTYAGWDRSGDDASSAVAIHHPATDEKSISFEYQATTTTAYLKEGVSSDETHVRVEDWDVGTTEPGSSGSPLFDQNHRVIGQLHGGYASCSSQTSDWYGRFNTSWIGDGSDKSSLKNWLDAAGTGDITTDTI